MKTTGSSIIGARKCDGGSETKVHEAVSCRLDDVQQEVQ